MGKGAAWLPILLLAMGGISLSDGAPSPDECEQEAARAYWQALKVCQLAEQDNPRLRCYEAAKEVYVRTLKGCQSGRGIE